MNRPTEQCRVQVSELQRRLAKKANDKPNHRFTKLYDLLTWEPLMGWAFDKLMTNAGSRTAGIDRMDKRKALQNRGAQVRNVRASARPPGVHPESKRETTPAWYPNADRSDGSTDGESHP
jgi:RNA-directed DNA polymerase